MEPAMVVLYPSPGMGHLAAMVELGKLIHTHHPSLSVTILIIHAPTETGSTDKYIASVSSTTPSIAFHHLPTVDLPPDFIFDHEHLSFGIPELYNPTVHNTLVSISQKSTIKAVVLDFFSNAAFHVSKSLNLQTYYFYTGGASGLCTFLYLPTIHNSTSKSFKDLNTNFDIPGVPPIHSSDMPKLLLDRKSYFYKNFLNTSSNMGKSSAIIVNSFAEFENRAVDTLRSGKCIPDRPTPPVYLLGPLTAGGNDQVDVSENECLNWLNSQPSKSVVFLCFGSMGLFKKNQLEEIAIGLEKSGQRFLWVVRNPPQESNPGAKEFDLDAILPKGFLARTRDKGLVVRNWAPQPAILSHESIGGFVSHCGWNSVLEAVVAGVPMVAWPLYAEQMMNRVYLVEEVKVALRLKMSSDGFVTAAAVEEKVRELMEGDQGRVVRERILSISATAKAAAEDGGSLHIEFLKLTQSWSTL